MKTVALEQFVLKIKGNLPHALFTFLWAYLTWCVAGTVLYLVLRCLTWNWNPDVPEWILKTTTTGCWLSSIYIIVRGFKRQLPGTRLKPDSSTADPSVLKRRIVLVAKLIGLIALGGVCNVMYSAVTETPDEGIAKAEEGMRLIHQELFNGDQKGFFDSIHSDGQIKSIKVNDVYSFKNNGGFINAYVTALHWKNKSHRDGYTQVVLFQQHGSFVAAQLLLTNGEVLDGWDSRLLSHMRSK